MYTVHHVGSSKMADCDVGRAAKTRLSSGDEDLACFLRKPGSADLQICSATKRSVMFALACCAPRTSGHQPASAVRLSNYLLSFHNRFTTLVGLDGKRSRRKAAGSHPIASSDSWTLI